jgi:hypothetical protein
VTDGIYSVVVCSVFSFVVEVDEEKNLTSLFPHNCRYFSSILYQNLINGSFLMESWANRPSKGFWGLQGILGPPLEDHRIR